MSRATRNRIRPPAIWKAGSVRPSRWNSHCPPEPKAVITSVAARAALHAVRRRLVASSLSVMAR
jgi:hypothetical protein